MEASAMNITPALSSSRSFVDDDDDNKCICNRRISCCRVNRWECGPLIPRWKCWCMCSVITYIVSLPIVYFLMHFMQYPGNFEGDHEVPGSSEIEFIAKRSDDKVMQALKVLYPMQPNSNQAPMIFFGGNAQGMSGAASDAILLLQYMARANRSYQFQLYSTAYRGYEPNTGFVTQNGLTKDAEDFLDRVLNSTHGSLDGRVILGGWSMGAGVAMQLAAARPESIAGLVVFSPWSSLRTESLNIAAPLSYLLYPYIWLSEKWDSLAAVSSLPADIPVAIISASADKVIPSWEHRLVFEASKASNKWWLPNPGADHAYLQLEVMNNQKQLASWMKASWSRVQKFNTTFRPQSSDVATDTFLEEIDDAVFDPVGDFVRDIHETLTPLIM